jgi:hypothetical protein
LSPAIPTGKMLSYIVTIAANVSNLLMLKLEKIETGSPVFAPRQVQTDENATTKRKTHNENNIEHISNS